MTASSPDEPEQSRLQGRHRGAEVAHQRRQFLRVVRDNPREPMLVAIGAFVGCAGSVHFFQTGGFRVAIGVLIVLVTGLLLVSYVAQFTGWFEHPRWFASRRRRFARRIVIHFWWVTGVVVLLTGFWWAV